MKIKSSATSPASATDIDIDLLKTMPLPEYADDANKSDYGKLLLIAGSRRIPGAAILAARAALRSGCGTVRLAAPESVATAIGIAVPELMVVPLPETAEGTIARTSSTLIEAQAEACDAVVMGPGLDENEETADLLRTLATEFPLPAVLDASAILALSSGKHAFKAPRILTPHLQEMSILMQREVQELEAAREQSAADFAHDWKAILVLKGRETLVSDKGQLFRNAAGTRGLGTAGSGDVLAGIIGGLLAQMATQKLDAVRAAVWGVHLHALAGEAAEKEYGDDGMTGSDVVGRLPRVLCYARKLTSKKSAGERTGLRPA